MHRVTTGGDWDYLANGVSGVVGLVGLGRREAVGEGYRECVQGWLPAYGPSCPAGPGRVQGPGDQVEADAQIKMICRDDLRRPSTGATAHAELRMGPQNGEG